MIFTDKQLRLLHTILMREWEDTDNDTPEYHNRVFYLIETVRDEVATRARSLLIHDAEVRRFARNEGPDQ